MWVSERVFIGVFASSISISDIAEIAQNRIIIMALSHQQLNHVSEHE